VVEKKVEKATYYNEQIRKMFNDEIVTPYEAPYATHVYMFYAVRFEDKATRDKVIIKLEQKGIETRVAFPAIHLQPLYQELFGYTRGYLPITEKVSDTILCLPIYPHITQEEQDHVLLALKEVFT